MLHPKILKHVSPKSKKNFLHNHNPGDRALGARTPPMTRSVTSMKQFKRWQSQGHTASGLHEPGEQRLVMCQ